MAALTFWLLTASCEIYKASSVLIRSGFSLQKCLNHIRQSREEHLFARYCRELWASETEKSSKSSLEVDVVRPRAQNISNYVANIALIQSAAGLSAKSDKINTATKSLVKMQSRFESVESAEECRSSAVLGDFEYVDDYFGEIPIQIGTEVDGSTFYDYTDPQPVYENSSLGSIHEGISFTVCGQILLNCERFSINLIIENQHRDIALHINPRIPQNYIVRNCRVKSLWGTEEVASALPFSLRRGSKFTIQILVTDEQYLISVNGYHFAEFRHRLPYKSVNCLEVKGEVDEVTFKRSEVLEYPHRLPEAAPKRIREHTQENDSELLHVCEDLAQKGTEISLPYYGILPRKFTNGKWLLINGRVKILPHSFYINLQSGREIWPHPIIAFHFNPRFAKATVGSHVICRNSWYNGKWDTEERSEITTDFCPGKAFSLQIRCSNESYEVYLNHKFISDYRFRVDPKSVDTIYIQGDIKLWDVALGSNVEAIGSNVNLYCNPSFMDD